MIEVPAQEPVKRLGGVGVAGNPVKAGAGEEFGLRGEREIRVEACAGQDVESLGRVVLAIEADGEPVRGESRVLRSERVRVGERGAVFPLGEVVQAAAEETMSGLEASDRIGMKRRGGGERHGERYGQGEGEKASRWMSHTGAPMAWGPLADEGATGVGASVASRR